MFEDTLFNGLIGDDLNKIILLSGHVCDVPVSTFAFSANNQLTIIASGGFSKSNLPALPALTSHQQLIVPDIFTDSRFVDSLLLKIEPSVHFFACFPVDTGEDLPDGWLCIMDYQVRQISDEQIAQLQLLAAQASSIVKLRLENLSLKKSKAFYENILNKIPTDVAVFDADHRYLFVNPGAISIEEYRNFIIGKDDYEYVAYRNRDISIADSRRENFLKVKNTGKEVRWEEDITGPKGDILTHVRRMYPVFDDDGALSIVIGFGMDITDRKLLEQKQVLLVKQLSAQNTQLTDFCNIVSHNLRAPLVNMSMLVEFIEEAEDTMEQKVLVSKLTPVIDNLHSTFNELVESIQIKQDLDIQSENIPLRDCLQRTVELMDPEIQKSGAVITVDFDDAPSVYFPPKYLYSIFQNLISNSLKYHSPKRNPVIKLASKKLPGKILLSVNDNGLGIDLVKQKNNIFKIGKVFHRHHDAKGFGLYMTKTQVEAMNGKIWAESSPGEGTTFFIEFTNQKE